MGYARKLMFGVGGLGGPRWSTQSKATAQIKQRDFSISIISVKDYGCG